MPNYSLSSQVRPKKSVISRLKINDSSDQKIGDPALTQDENTPQKEARLVAVQDDQGFHLCSRFLKEYTPEGNAVFEDDGRILMSYGVYEIAIQDLENCLEFARAMRDKAIKDKAETDESTENLSKEKMQ